MDWTHGTWTVSLKIGQNSDPINNFMMEVTLISGEIIQLIVLGECGKTKPKFSHNYTWHYVLKYSRNFKCKYKNTSEFKENIKKTFGLRKAMFFCLIPKPGTINIIENWAKKWRHWSLGHVWLCDFMDCSPPGSSVHGLFLARPLEWAAIFSSWASSQPRSWTQISCIGGWFFTVWATIEHLKIKEIHMAKSNIKNIDIKWYTWKDLAKYMREKELQSLIC